MWAKSPTEVRTGSDNYISAMQRTRLWDIFCQVIDNHGDLGVCWRLARQLADAGQAVRLWVDDGSALSWMAGDLAPQGITVLPWTAASQAGGRAALPTADVWIEAFGCHLPEAFVAWHVAEVNAGRARIPAWINLEYLSAEDGVRSLHGLPSPVMSGPAKGWTKRFYYPGFQTGTGGLLREADLVTRQQAFDRPAWRSVFAPGLSADSLLISLFCYEPAALPDLLTDLGQQRRPGDGRVEGLPHQLLVTPGRPWAAVQRALAGLSPGVHPQWTALPYTDQDGFDHMLWAADLNLVRGEDSLVRALWAGQPFVWHIYPQDDDAHHAKLEAFLDWLEVPDSLRRFHRVWNGLETGKLPTLDADSLALWADCTQAARRRLLAQDDLLTSLVRLKEIKESTELPLDR